MPIFLETGTKVMQKIKIQLEPGTGISLNTWDDQ